MTHIVIFPTWACQLNCDYCSIRHSKIDGTVKGVAWQEWAKAISANVPKGSVIDIAGGEPLLYPGIVDLLNAFGSNGYYWALTTNAKATEQIDRLCKETPRGGVCINISDHAGNPEARANKLKLRKAGYRVNVHRVDHPSAGHNHPDAQLISYQDWQNGKAVDGKTRHCTAGLNHWIANPNGDMWRCIVAAQTGQPANGNLFTGGVEKLSMECNFGCSSCYNENPASWLIEMRELDVEMRQPCDYCWNDGKCLSCQFHIETNDERGRCRHVVGEGTFFSPRRPHGALSYKS